MAWRNYGNVWLPDIFAFMKASGEKTPLIFISMKNLLYSSSLVSWGLRVLIPKPVPQRNNHYRGTNPNRLLSRYTGLSKCWRNFNYCRCSQWHHRYQHRWYSSDHSNAGRRDWCNKYKYIWRRCFRSSGSGYLNNANHLAGNMGLLLPLITYRWLAEH